MSRQDIQSKENVVGTGIPATFDHTEDMSGWTLVGYLKTTTGTLLNTKTPSIGTGPNGANTRATFDYSTGAFLSKTLAAGAYSLAVWRTDAGAEDLLGLVQWSFVAQG
jgi:hypothetical protein